MSTSDQGRPDRDSLHDKVVLVTGGSRGMGAAIARRFAGAGCRVAIGYRNESAAAHAVLGDIAELGAQGIGVAGDISNPDDARAMVAQVIARFGHLDIVVNCAGIAEYRPFEAVDSELFRATFDTNVLGTIAVIQAALPHLTGSAGNMIYMSTTGASYTGPWQGMGLYQITKAALNRLADHWRVEQPGLNFTLVTIGECPGGQGDRQTQFNADWDSELVGQVAADWFARQYLSGAFIDVEHLVDQFHSLVTMGQSLQVPSMVIIPRPPIPDDTTVKPTDFSEMEKQLG